jgi:hypothetical protein
MKTLLTGKSFVEILFGLVLLLIPATLVSLALGVPLERSGGLILARLGGIILLAVGIACWRARNHSESGGAIRLVVALLIYDVSVVAILLIARLAAHLSGIALWPVVFLHWGLGLWSLVTLRKNP